MFNFKINIDCIVSKC